MPPREPVDEDVRRRLGRASAELLAAVLAAVAGIGGLVIWHLARRGRVLREGLGPPRPVRWPVSENDRDPQATDPR